MSMNKAQLAQMELARRELARRHLRHFVSYTFPGYIRRPHNQLVADTIDLAVYGIIKRLMIFMPAQYGKLISHTTPVLTTKGWKTHGELQVGDYVFGPDGLPKRVMALSVEMQCNREVEFTDGSVIQTHANHEWVVYDRRKNGFPQRILETDQMLEMGLWIGEKGKPGGRARFQVDANVPVQMPDADLPIHPYVLGLWLGDGRSDASTISHHADDTASIDKVVACGYKISSHWVQKDTNVHYTNFSGLIADLRALGLYNNKHIPDQYFVASEQQRAELLAGLIDSDGYVYKNGRTTFVNANKRLIDDVERLVSSLGWRACIVEQQPTTSTSGIEGKQVIYYLSFNPTYDLPVAIKRKRNGRTNPQRRRRAIKEIREIPPVPGRCIQVEGGVYLVGNKLVPTHNSELVSRKTPPFVLGKFPNKRIILCSYNAELAYSFSREARDLISSQAYQNIFGKGALEEERGVELSEQAKSVKAWNLKGMRGGLVAAGVGGGITGFSADFAIIDDPIKDDDEALSEKVRQRHWDWYWSALYTRLSPNSPIIFTMTRWHEDDLAGRLLKAQERNNEYWHVLRMPAVAEHPNQIKKWAEENYVHPSRLLNRRTVTQMLEDAIADGRIR